MHAQARLGAAEAIGASARIAVGPAHRAGGERRRDTAVRDAPDFLPEMREDANRGPFDSGGSDAGTRSLADPVDERSTKLVFHDGDVVVVPAGSLPDLGHIALFTRY